MELDAGRVRSLVQLGSLGIGQGNPIHTRVPPTTSFLAAYPSVAAERAHFPVGERGGKPWTCQLVEHGAGRPGATRTSLDAKHWAEVRAHGTGGEGPIGEKYWGHVPGRRSCFRGTEWQPLIMTELRAMVGAVEER